MSCLISLALPSLPLPTHKFKPINCNHSSLFCISETSRKENISAEPRNDFKLKSNLVIPLGILASVVAEPAFAVTGVNDQEDFISVLIQVGIIAFGYFFIMPPIILNWLRIRWYRRKLLEMYVQFMFVFIFFPGVLLWAPFMNFRKFPRDPTLKYPWSVPDNPSEVKGGFLKFPWATIEDYE